MNVDFYAEKENLTRILFRISEIITEYGYKYDETVRYIAELYDTYTPEESNYHIEIPAYENIRENYKKDLVELKKSKNSPYFGKLIYTRVSDKKRKIIYLGKKSIINFDNDTEDIPVVDWRTPVAEVYYNGRIGETSYSAPQGIINILLELKRTLKIEKSELVNIYDAEVISNDELLLEFLSQNKEAVLNEIIATIQEEQNKIIRKSINRNVVVQGVAGSGKTTVALHRISFLMYQNKEILKGENFYLIAANSLFLNYITAMLPDLDIPFIRQNTMLGALLGEISKYDEKFEQSFQHREAGREIYSNFLNAFGEYIYCLEEEIFCERNIVLFGKYLLTDLYIDERRHRSGESLSGRAKKLDSLLADNIKKEKLAIINYILRTAGQPETDEFIRSVFKTEPEYADDYFLNENYKRLSARYGNYFTKKIKKLRAEKLFYDFTGARDGFWSHNDLACLLLFHNFIGGSGDTETVKHIIVDEAQDFSAAVYLCLRRVFRGATFTVVGDIMQSITETGLDCWEDILDGVFDGRADFDEMLKSYRNTLQISEFAKKTAREMSGREIKTLPFKRIGKEVERIKDLPSLVKILAEIKERHNINAVICRDGNSAETLQKALEGLADIKILDVNGDFSNGTYIVTVGNSKGLEFDSVIIYGFDSYEDEEYKSLYVAATRALHELYIMN